MRTVCDNLKTGVIKHPKQGDIILNEAYEALGSHYLTAIMPTGVKKPKQKASVEGTVGKVATAIIASLRNEVFYSLQSLHASVRRKLDEFNAGHFRRGNTAAARCLRRNRIIFIHCLRFLMK